MIDENVSESRLDTVIIGFNESDFAEYVPHVRAMGERSGAFRDLELAYVQIEGKPLRALDVLNFTRQSSGLNGKRLHNADFLWPVITYLTTYIRRRGLSCKFLNLFQDEKERLREMLKNERPLTVAITTTLYVEPLPIIEVIKFVREISPDCKIVVGGPYPSNLAKGTTPAKLAATLGYIGADYYIFSTEGEATFCRLLHALRAGKTDGLREHPNLGFFENGEFVMTRCETEKNALEENMVDYSSFAAEEIGDSVSTRTAKSCPFACAFCGFPQRSGDYLFISPDLVERELDTIEALGSVREVTFIDDTFNVPKNRFKEILRRMIKKRYRFRWNSYYRCDHGDAEIIGLMRDAGCEGVFLGCESGSDRMLKLMNKAARRAHFMQYIPLLREAGIVTHANFIVGFPGETTESVDESISLIEEAQPDFYRAQLWYADPTTPIWRRKDEFGVVGQAFNWTHATMNNREASDWVEHMFRTIKGSAWLPQYGFELWSVFYLQRKGLSLQAIKEYVRTFNSVIKTRLEQGEQKEEEAMRRLLDFCRTLSWSPDVDALRGNLSLSTVS